MTILKGWDISLWQTFRNYDLLNNDTNISFVIIKAGQALANDPKFVLHTTNINKPMGAYHFYRPMYDPIAQARKYYDIAKKFTPQGFCDIETVIKADLEYYKTKPILPYRANIRKYLDELERLWSKKPVIYTSWGAWNFIMGVQTWVHNYELWVANYGVIKPGLPFGWTKWRAWQYTDKGKHAAIYGDIDFNYFDNSDGRFQSFFTKAPYNVYIPIVGGSPEPVEEEVKKLVVVTNTLNIRRGPSTTYSTTGTMVKGDKPEELETLKVGVNEWSRIGWKQWAAKKYSGVEYMKYL